MGAGVEILYFCGMYQGCESHPSWGAGVEILGVFIVYHFILSHPTRVRELKWRLHDLWQVRYTAALPHGVRELKDNPTWQ